MKKFSLQNTVVLSGLVLKDCHLKTLGEFDFIVISLPLKSIIQIEAKRGNNPKNIEHAEKQLNRGEMFFEENIPFSSSDKWKYIRMMCFGESVEKDTCVNCKCFILGSTFIQDKTLQSVSEEISDQFYSFLCATSTGNSSSKFVNCQE
jgi:hypothetical protein